MSSLCITMWKSPRIVVHNTGLSTYQQTTRVQDVPMVHFLTTGKTVISIGFQGVNPQSTGLITVIRFIYKLTHLITPKAHIFRTQLAR